LGGTGRRSADQQRFSRRITVLPSDRRSAPVRRCKSAGLSQPTQQFLARLIILVVEVVLSPLPCSGDRSLNVSSRSIAASSVFAGGKAALWLGVARRMHPVQKKVAARIRDSP